MTPEEYAYGLHPVESLIATHPEQVREISVAAGRHDRRLATLIAAAEARGIAVRSLHGGELDRLLPGARHQGVIATLAPQPQEGRREQDLAAFLAGLDARLSCWSSMASRTRTIWAPACAPRMRPACRP